MVRSFFEWENYVDVGDFGMKYLNTLSDLRFLSPEWSCHPTFAMTGALAWQVKQILIKKSFIGFGGDRTGVARDLFLVWCVVCSFSFPFIITYLLLDSPYYDSLEGTDTSADFLRLHNEVLSIQFSFESVTVF